MRSGIPARLLHRNGHNHHTAAIALASCGAGLAIGTAAGALMAHTLHRAPGTEEALDAAEAE